MDFLNMNRIITKSDDKTNIKLEFDVPQGINKLLIDYTYSPKTVEDEQEAIKEIEDGFNVWALDGENYNAEDYLPVKNLITLSLDDPFGYRGAAHRQSDNQHHEISEDFASNGFLKGKIAEGKWRVTLNVHCCRCNVGYTISVKGVE